MAARSVTAHFIGGPWHGMERGCCREEREIRGLHSPRALSYDKPEVGVPLFAAVDEFTYTYIGDAAGYACYQYEGER